MTPAPEHTPEQQARARIDALLAAVIAAHASGTHQPGHTFAHARRVNPSRWAQRAQARSE